MKSARFFVALMIGLAVFLLLEQYVFQLTQGIEVDIQDGWMRWRNRNHSAASEEIALILVDEATFMAYDGAPPPRSVQAKLIKALQRNKATTIALDFTYDMDREGTDELAVVTQQSQQLIYGVTVRKMPLEPHFQPSRPLPQLVLLDLKIQNRPPEERYMLDRLPCSALRPHVRYLSHIMLSMHRSDETIRHLPLLMPTHTGYSPALSLLAVCLYKGVPLDSSGITVKWGKSIKLDNQKGWQREIPIDPMGQMRINYIGDTSRFEQSFSFGNLARDLEEELRLDSWSDFFADKLVLIGNGSSQADWTPTPFSTRFPGVAVHATAIANILEGEFVQDASPLWAIGFTLCLSGLLVSFQLWGFQEQKQSCWRRGLITLGVFSGSLLIYVGFAFLLFHQQGVFLNVVLPIVGVTLTWMLATYFCYTDEIQRRDDEQKRYQWELSQAFDIQKLLMPEHPPTIPGMSLVGRCEPAAETSGDFYAYFSAQPEQGQIRVALADVCGKSLQGAMIAMMTHGMLLQAVADAMTDSDQLLSRLNEQLLHALPPRTFVCLELLKVDLQNRNLHIVSAGQWPPVVWRSGKRIPIEMEGMPLGIWKRNQYESVSIDIERGDIIVAFTDGLVEAQNEFGEFYGEGRVEAVLRRLKKTPDATEVLTAITEDLSEFRGKSPVSDDVTIVVMVINTD